MKTVLALARLFTLMCKNPKMTIFVILAGVVALAMLVEIAQAIGRW